MLLEVLRSFRKYSKYLAGMFVFKVFLRAARPFVLLHFSAAIVNGLYSWGESLQNTQGLQQSAQELLPYFWQQAFWMAAWAMGMELCFHLVERRVGLALQRISYEQTRQLSRKAMEMPYSMLESGKVQELIGNIRQFKFQRGDVFAKEVQFLESFMEGVFAVLGSLTYVGRFAAEKLHSGADVGQLCLVLATFFLLTAASVFITIKNSAKHNENLYKQYQKEGATNRFYAFYRQNIFKNYQYGKEIRIFDEQELIEDEFGKVLKRMAAFMRKMGKEESGFRLVDNVLNMVLGGIAYIYIGLNAYQRMIGVGGIVKYSGAVNQLFSGVMQVIRAVGSLKGNEKFLRQYDEFLNLEAGEEIAGGQSIGEAAGGKRLLMGGMAGREKQFQRRKHPCTLDMAQVEAFTIRFEHVYFKYQNAQKWTLEDVNFHISHKEHVAMVGRNGSGKTTCIRLLLRLYQPDAGRILLNGVDIREYDEREYWNLMSVVFQDFKLFSIGLGQNIAGTEQTEGQRLAAALENMGMGETVGKMYAGVDSCLYKDYDGGGVLISGGEAQKLAIAKALYKDAPVFIMDEPSAALDPVSESELYEKTNTLMGEKTMIFISHRLSSCCFCDKILVWKEGRIVETGRHEELLGLGGEYSELWTAQARHYRE